MLDLLPTRADSAASNMAADFLLLKRYPAKTHARFRAYGWHRPAFSFGYSQKIDWVRAQLPPDALADPHAVPELVRRPTGGGVVDHRDDWTYALVIPRGHPLETARAVESYRAVHAALADALRSCGQPATLKDRCDQPCGGSASLPPALPAPPTICFTRPELHDVVHPDSGQKIAGAAQKRTKDGLLFQGSLLRAAVPRIQDYYTFHAAFAAALAQALGLPGVETPWPEFPEGELETLAEHYGSPEWRDLR